MKLSHIAEYIGGSLEGPDVDVNSIKSIDSASSQDLTILLDKRYLKQATTTKAKAIVSYTKDVGPKSVVLVKNTRQILPDLLNLFKDKDRPIGISDRAYMSETVVLGKNVFIAANVVVGENTVIGDEVQIHSGVSIGKNVGIGKGTIINPNVSIYDRTEIGKNCIIHSGVVIGADGFGFEKDEKHKWLKVPQLAKVIIEDNVEIGANSCIDRGAIQDTVIGEGTKIDNLVQVGHNCRIGKHNVISAATAIAGSTTVGDYCMWGGQAGTAGHLHIGDNVTIMGRAGITKNIKEGETIQGFPAKNFRVSFKEQAFLQRWLKKEMNKEDT